MDLTQKRILFIDLDGTLINTISGNTFPEDITDFRIRLDVLKQIKDKLPNLEFIHIVSNQGGIATGKLTTIEFETKFDAIIEFINGFFYIKGNMFAPIEVSGDYCTSNDKDNPKRKPNTGMIDNYVMYNYLKDKELMIMIGDASGKEGDLSDSDKVCASNAGIDYIDVRDFLAL